jgi:VanZ family protein
MNADVVKIIVISFLCAGFIMVYGFMRCRIPGYKDPLTKTVFGERWKEILDGWSLAHLLFYMLLGYMFPDYLILIVLIGAAWEVVESLSQHKPFYLSGCKAQKVISTDPTNSAQGWWYSKFTDLIHNTIGAMIGYMLAKGGFKHGVEGIVGLHVLNLVSLMMFGV